MKPNPIGSGFFVHACICIIDTWLCMNYLYNNYLVVICMCTPACDFITIFIISDCKSSTYWVNYGCIVVQMYS